MGTSGNPPTPRATLHRSALAAAAFLAISSAGLVAPPAAGAATTADVFAHTPVAVAPTHDGAGFWTVYADGTVTTNGDAVNYGGMAGQPLNKPMVGIAPTADGKGYWLLGADGGVFSFGDATFHGSTGSMTLNAPALQMVSDADSGGYWFVAGDGGVFTFGNAAFHGSTGGMRLNQPVVGMAATSDGGGYWLVASDGGIFTFGDATFHGSTGGSHLNQPVVGMARTADNGGYWLVAADGGVFTFGDAVFHGSAGGTNLGGAHAVGLVSTADGGGYWITLSNGDVLAYGDASGSATQPPPTSPTTPPPPPPCPYDTCTPPPPPTANTGNYGDSNYAFLGTNSQGVPARWNPCDTVTYAVLTTNAPTGWQSDLANVINQAQGATGLTFRSVGTYTSFSAVPTTTSIVIEWDPASAMPNPGGGGYAEAYTSTLYRTDSTSTPQMDSAHIYVLDSLPSGFGSGGDGPALLHEFGHALGLDDIGSINQAYPEVEYVNNTSYPTWQPGDLDGLYKLSSAMGCNGFTH